MFKRSVFILALLVTLLAGLLLAPGSFSRAAQSSTTSDPDRPRAFSDWSAPVNIDTTGSSVNSSVMDQHPALSRKGLSLFFVSNRTPGVGGLDIWVCQRASVKDLWGPPQNLGPVVNSSSTENAPTLSPDGRLLFFASNRPGGNGGNDIWVSRRHNRRDDFGWGPPVNLGPAINTAADEEGPTYFEDEETGSTVLYFTSNRPWGAGDCNGPKLGDFDIYMSTLQDDETFGCVCLVPELSSPVRDTRTAIRRDGLEIFITSNRALGQGLLDLWAAKRESTSEPWSTPVNLGSTVNGAFNDGAPALSFKGTTLYFYSDRPGGLGGNDLQVATRKRLGRDDSDGDDDDDGR
ncbi:MAG: PD40 domain-containing protein [Pyrinomonadaceae bacterium]|nr:PD40 domain-containing protein [Pyrinomonadaceae bacterium]